MDAALIPWATAEQELRAQRFAPVDTNAYGQWWQTPWGTTFFVQWINGQRDVDAAAFRQQMQEIGDQRQSLGHGLH
jgi:hypothetical protein